MKARKLREFLGTDRPIADWGDYIGVGSYMCHDLIKLEKSTLKLTYALDSHDRTSLQGKGRQELLEIWDKLADLIKTGKIHEFLEGEDNIPGGKKVFTVEDGLLQESIIDEIGYPNTDSRGKMTYENTHFFDPQAALQYGLRGEKAMTELYVEKVARIQNELAEATQTLDTRRQNVIRLEAQLKACK